jgi:hypothetical protein
MSRATSKLLYNKSITSLFIKTKLITLAQKFNGYSNFHFYTDDSVKQIGTQQCTSGYNWIQTHPNTSKLSFKGSTVFFPSSTKSEGILTALNTLPFNSNYTIFTDSMNCIFTYYEKRLKSSVIIPWRKLKQNNFLIWDLIFWLPEHRHIHLTLKKVKAHSNIEFNGEADKLASAGTLLEDPIIVNFKFFNATSCNGTIYTYLIRISDNHVYSTLWLIIQLSNL